MKVRSLHLERFKKFWDYSIHFTDDKTATGHVLDLIVLVGDNGSGKSSILQAIAATLGCATGNIRHPNELRWPGFVYNRASAAHHGYSHIDIEVEFTSDEIAATQEYFQQSDFSTVGQPPTSLDVVRLELNENDVLDPVRSPNGRAAYFQFRGREYVFNLLRRGRRGPMFERVGGVKWYNDRRNAASVSPSGVDNVSNLTGIDAIRYMIGSWDSKSSSLGVSRLEKLNNIYKQLFSREFSRRGDIFSANEIAEVFFSDGVSEYEIAEASGGEQAIMPIILDFVNWGIHNSVILIDEIELHLHPPLQQALVAVLPELGNNNQFIITTHSEAVFDIVPSTSVIRVSS
jgi:predicted ATPase